MVQTAKLDQTIEIMGRDNSFDGRIILIKKGCIAIEFQNDFIDAIRLTTGTNLDYRVTIDKNTYIFVSTIIGIRVNNTRTIALLSPPRTASDSEKRKYYRANISIKVEYCLLPYKSGNLSLNDVSYSFYQELKDSTTIDISEGGMKIKTKEEFMSGRYALLTIYIPDKVIILGKTIRSVPNSEGSHDTAFEYVSLQDPVRKKISDFIMEKSMEKDGDA